MSEKVEVEVSGTICLLFTLLPYYHSQIERLHKSTRTQLTLLLGGIHLDGSHSFPPFAPPTSVFREGKPPRRINWRTTNFSSTKEATWMNSETFLITKVHFLWCFSFVTVFIYYFCEVIAMLFWEVTFCTAAEANLWLFSYFFPHDLDCAFYLDIIEFFLALKFYSSHVQTNLSSLFLLLLYYVKQKMPDIINGPFYNTLLNFWGQLWRSW